MPLQQAYVGVDIGTASSKGVLVDTRGSVLRTATREHPVHRPHPGHVEVDPETWWTEFLELCTELTTGADVEVRAVGVSGMGPCVVIADKAGDPLRPAILYGVDTRAVTEIAELTEELGAAEVLRRTGSTLSTQAVGPKLRWIARHEPQTWARARKLFMPASFLAHRLTGEYVLDFHSASQCNPLFDLEEKRWDPEWSTLADPVELPRLLWAGDRAGVTTGEFAGIPAGTPVIAGTIDAWTEAVSADAQNIGDLMLMYGTTMFLVATSTDRVTDERLWGTLAAYPDRYCLAGGMATSGAITGWLRDLTGQPYSDLVAQAAVSKPGANGLLMLPYFAGERTPFADPDARGVLAGLTLDHTAGDVYRAALEATAHGVRHNVEAMCEGGAKIERIVAVGGGTTGRLWPQIVSDVTGLPQVVPKITIGASYGAAALAAKLRQTVDVARWNPPAVTLHPDPAARETYDRMHSIYRDLYPATRNAIHALSALQHQS